MAEASNAQAPPTFKLVLVGDGGTGKVCSSLPSFPSLPSAIADARYMAQGVQVIGMTYRILKLTTSPLYDRLKDGG